MIANIADAAPFAYVTNAGTGTGTDTVSVIDTASNSIVATVPILGLNGAVVPTHPYGVAVSPAGNRVYVSAQLTKTVSVIDSSSTNNTVIATIDNGGLEPGGLAVSPAGSRLLVANDKTTSINVYNTSAPYNLVTTISDTSNNSFTGLAIVPGVSGAFTVYATAAGSGKVVVINCNENTDSYTKATEVGVGNTPIGIAYNPTNNKLYVANMLGGTVSVISAASNTVTATVALTGSLPAPIGVAVNAAGNKVYVTDGMNNKVAIIDGSSDTLLSSPVINTDQAPYGLAFNPANSTLYVANGKTSTPPGTVTAYNTASSTSSTINVNNNPIAFGNFIGPVMGCVVTVTTDGNGSTSPAPGLTDNIVYGATGQNLTISSAPNCGFAANTFTADGSTVASPYTFAACNAPHTMGATFTRTGWVLATSKSGVGTGTVSCAPTPTSCTSGGYYPFNTTVTCTATADTPYSFGGWTNCPSASGNVCTIVIPALAGPAPATLTASFVSGGPVKCLNAGTYWTWIQDGYNSLLASDTISVTSSYNAAEVVNFTRADIPLVVELRGGATDITHPAWAGATTIHGLNIGGNGANGTTVNIAQQTINIQ
jgi:YVTN family beta-propeller protein